MELLQLLQEASSLGLSDLKKAMQKDKRIALIFKTDSKLDQIEDKAAFLSTVKYFLLNNENVRKFIASRNNVKDLSLSELTDWRKLRANDLTEDKFNWLKEFVKVLFKEYGTVDRGTISRDARKLIDEFVNGNSRYHDLPHWAQRELMSVPGIRPKKRVLLYRGLLFSEQSLKNREKYDGTLEKGEGLKFLSAIRKGTRAVDLEWDRASSWTTSREVAQRFAMYGPASSHNAAMMDWFSRAIDKRHIDGALGYVVATYANPEDVLVDVNAYNSTVHHQHGNEAEMILKPGKYLARIVEKHTVSGQVDPDEPTSDSDAPALKAVEAVKKLAASTELPPEVDSLKQLNYFRSADLLRDMSLFKKLVTNSTTTTVMHSFDKLMEFYRKELAHLSPADLRADKYAHDEKASAAIQKLKAFVDHFDDTVNHSKFVTKDNSRGKGKKHQLSSEEYRATIKPYDLFDLEKDLLTKGRVTSRSGAEALGRIAHGLGMKIATSHLHQTGAAKQQDVIDSVLTSFFKAVGVDKPSDRNEAIKGALNLMRKAYRNAKLISELESVHAILGDLK